MSDDERIAPDEHRDVLLPVIQRWFPDDDAPYDRIDELVKAARLGGFEPGVKEWAVDYWCARVTDAEAERDRLRDAAELFKNNALDVGTELERVKAENARLEAELAEAMCNGQSTEGAYHDLRAERDRLRTAVERLRRYHDEVIAGTVEGGALGVIEMALRDADQLDRSGEGT